jgi:hypothetical protein
MLILGKDGLPGGGSAVTKREAELIEQGWQRRFVAAEPRLGEMAALYEQTGFAVHLEPLSAVHAPDKNSPQGGCEACMICFQGSEDRYQVIYTRPKDRGTVARKKETGGKKRSNKLHASKDELL